MNLVRSLIILCAPLAVTLCGAAGPDAMPLLLNGKANEALQFLNSQVQNNPNDARAYNLLCRVHFQLEHWEDAIRAAERSVALAPQDSEYHQWLARSYGRKAEAAGPLAAFSLVRKVKSEFEKAVALDTAGKNLSARSDMAEFYIEAPYIMGGDKAKARRLAEFVRRQDPALADSMLAHLDEKQNAKERAERDYKAAIQESGNMARYWVALAAFYRRSGRLDEMEAAIIKSLSAPRLDGIHLFDGASLLLASGRNFPEATRMLRQYLSPDDPAEDGPTFHAYYMLGLLQEKQGNGKAAAAEYHSALALASGYRPAQEGLTRVSH